MALELSLLVIMSGWCRAVLDASEFGYEPGLLSLLLGPLDSWGVLTNLGPRPVGKWPEFGIDKLDDGDTSTELRFLMSLKPGCRGGLSAKLDLEGLKG